VFVSKDHVFIIGASSSIGCEVIRQIAHADMTIWAHFNTNAAKIDLLSKEVSASILPLQADLRSEADIEAMLEAIESRQPCPDKMILLAAPGFSLTRFKDLGWPDFQTQLDIQLRAAVLICRRFLPKMAAAKSGKVVFVLTSYTLGIPPMAMAHYVTAKFALLGFMKAMSSEYAAKGVCINAISPAMVDTDFLGDIPDKIVEMTADRHPLKRNALPSDIAPMVKFLLSDGARYMTGVNVPITGGAN
jgi:3-oxoacyl-[acyl-carrier protein] reductase